MSCAGHTVLDAAPSAITAADETDGASETPRQRRRRERKQEDVDTATTSNYRIIQARSSRGGNPKKKRSESPRAKPNCMQN